MSPFKTKKLDVLCTTQCMYICILSTKKCYEIREILIPLKHQNHNNKPEEVQIIFKIFLIAQK